ncbi:WXG100 family type VII secretion target [Streptomyces sp. NPDC048629]|uniref:WXG100 family type VII secretion target n=1 Tax=Streptomyces sp. NPDC048629 TaxID=3154824 RepID=UPI00344939E4
MAQVTAADFPAMEQALGMISQTLESCRQVQTNTEQHVESLMSTWEASSQQIFRNVMEKFSERCLAIRSQLDTIENKLQDTLGKQRVTEEEQQIEMSRLQQLMDGAVTGEGVG